MNKKNTVLSSFTQAIKLQWKAVYKYWVTKTCNLIKN